ncbi:MAG: uL15 family ribosomal protein [Clostridia bacterium]|nr:uL15 family ribosomal protein [Clostridia bacterium]
MQETVVSETEENVEETDDANEETEEEEQVRKVRRIDGHVRYIIIKYNKSFTAKIIQSSDEVKAYYSEIKNELLSYKGVKARMSWKGETFYSGRTTYAKLCVRGKCLSLFLALDPKEYLDSKYIVDDMSEIATYDKTPCLYRLKNDRRIKYSKELIETVMNGREKLPEPEQVDWASKYPYEETQPLVDRGLIKELTEEDAQSGDVFLPRDCVLASEVDELMQDEVAVALVEENEEISDKTKTDIINIDTLGKYFENGETATLEEMKKRIPAINRKATYIKVLARGTLDKKLTVIADSFSIQAVKMILLTGGNVVKKKNS